MWRLLPFVILGLLAARPAGALTLEVRVEGLEGDMLQAALADLSIEQQKDHPYLNDALVRRLHAQAPEEITTALQAFGYYRSAVKPALEQDGDRYVAVYTVRKGDPVLVTSVDIEISGEGSRSPRLVALVERFPLQKGSVLDHGLYEEGKKALLSEAVQRGYLDALFTENEVLVSTEKGTARVVLRLDTGPRYRFGPVRFEQDFISWRYLRGFVTIEEGDPYDQRVLLDLQRALYDTNQFSSVEVSAPRSEAEGLTVPVTVTLTPGPARRFTVGVGYGTDTGPRLRTGWEHRRITRDVHRLKTELLVSPVQSMLSGLYLVPLKRPRTDHLDYTLTFTRERVEDIDSDRMQVGIRRVRLRGRLEISENVRYLLENYDVATDEDRTSLLYPGLGFTYVRADSRVNTRHGFRLDLEIQGAAEGFVSQFTFLQARLRAKYITAVGGGGRLILRGERATTWIEDFEPLPGSLRFFAGGDQSVRGFAYKSLSPLDASGEAVGGRYLVVGSVEYEQSLSRKLSAAVFSDTGNALEKLSDPLERGAGVGLRVNTIVGLVRLDVAWALSREDRPWRIHLNIGPDL